MSDWDGEGLPPVGTVCEYRLGDSHNWFQCKIVMHVGSQGTVIKAPDIFEGIQYCSANGNQAVEFRPIRTAEEVAVEAMRKAVNSDNGKPSRVQVCRDIYNAIRDGKIPGVKLEEKE